MKKNMLKKHVAAVAACSVVLFAMAGQTVYAGSGSATVDGEVIDELGNVTWTVTGDDSNTSTTDKVDIDIEAKIVEHGDIVYKVDIEWGNMQFEFKNQTGTWNPDTHQYDAGEDGGKAWDTFYVDGTNNEITLTNHSNAVVEATFNYAHAGTPFNATDGADAVRGHFFTTNAAAITAAGQLTGTATTAGELDSAITINHQDKARAEGYGGFDGGDGSCVQNVYFTFNGTPDAEKVSGLADFTKVGVITVTITPATTP